MRNGYDIKTGSFRAAIGGSFAALVDGPASFRPSPRPELGDVALHLHGETGDTAIDLLYLGAELPQGLDGVADLYRGNPRAGEWVAIVSTKEHDRLHEPFFSAAGQVRVSRDAAGRLVGSFALEARSGPQDAGGEGWISVAGDFSAVPAELELPMFAGRVTWEWDLSDMAEGCD